ncbi:hypothetical protein QJQ45_013290 [Haematococcus lacustris]|nr:hypothetical protein QJQ45_013290 [Haematococcus lacustris]
MAARKLIVCLALIVLGSATAQLLSSRAPAPAPAGGGKSVYDVAASLPDTTLFAQLIRVARADPTVAQLTDPGFVGVVFAPTNKLIKVHMIVGQALQLSQLLNDMKLRSASGEVVEIDTGKAMYLRAWHSSTASTVCLCQAHEGHDSKYDRVSGSGPFGPIVF